MTGARSAGKPLRVAVVGAGPRSLVYTRCPPHATPLVQVVAVADPNSTRREALADAHHVPPHLRFESHEALAARPPVADAVINTTLDTAHFASTLPLIEAGYHVLLEKPIAAREAEVRRLIDAARKHQRIVMVCHVLRYEAFYQAVRSRLQAGEIGRLISIETTEQVVYDHLATTYLRHPRNLQPAIFPMLLSKCCHDLDIVAWLAGAAPLRVSSAIKSTQFRPENAPTGAALRCLDGCAVEATCRYSARALYVEDDTWDAYAWPANEFASPPPTEEKIRLLRTSSPYGRCAWHCPNPAIDQQSVLIEFAGGVRAAHHLYCATPRARRTLHLLGTEGEIEADYLAGKILIRKALRGAPGRFVEEHQQIAPVDLKSPSPRACEWALVKDFVGTVRGEADSPGLTRIEQSLSGHQIAFAADTAAREGRVVELTE